MRIDEIIIHNYRQFSNIELIFNKVKENDLFIVIGRNGTGKTNLLNAINWCLYDDEPHLSKDSKGIPILNLNTIKESNPGEGKEVLVKVGVKTDDGHYFSFERKALFVIDEEKKYPIMRQSSFTASYPDKKGNMKFIEDDEAEVYVNRFFPRKIREFFFFDGERLDGYFKEAKAQNISNAIFEISQIDLLDKIGKNLENLSREYAREMGKTSPLINDTALKLDREKDNLTDCENRIKHCKEQIETANNEINDLTKNLSDLPDVSKLENERQALKEDQEVKVKVLEDKTREKSDLLIEYGKIIYFYPAIKKALSILEERHRSGEIPPSIDKDILKEMLSNEICKICGRGLDSHSKDHVEKLLEKFNMSTSVARKLLLMEAPLKQYLTRLVALGTEIYRASRDIKQYEDDLASIDKKLNDIDKEMSGYNADQIKSWYQRRSEYERIKSDNEEKLGRFKAGRDEVKKKISDLKVQLEEEMDREFKAENIKKRVDLCNKASRIVTNAKEFIMQETRKEIGKETKDIFFKLLWKKETFSDVRINTDYSLSLIHHMGYDCLGNTSAAERELLALAFTLALHKTSGFDSPILIDTPVARVADEHRENFAKIFASVSREKQTILLFTSAEYSHEISGLLEKKYSGRYYLNMGPNEKETKIGV